MSSPPTATPTPPPASEPPPARSSREIWTVMGGLVLCLMLAMLDNTVVGPALPTIVGDLGGLEHLSWVITGYTLAAAVTALIWGKIGDLFGRKPALLASIGIFLAGSALTGLSESMTELIGFRALQGIGAGGLLVGVFATIGELVPPRDRGRYMGGFSAVMPIAMIGGPLIGGWITDHVSWHWIFYINVPVGLIAAAVVTTTLHLSGRTRDRARIDWLGAGLLILWAGSAVLLASWAGTQYAWLSGQTAGLAVIALAGLAVFIVHERRASDPILPLGIFTSRNFSLAGALAFLAGLTMMGAATFLPQFQQLVQGMSATNSGLLLLPLMLTMTATATTVGQLMSRTGRTRIFPLVGGVLLTASMVAFTTVGVDTTTLATGLMMGVLGIGIGCLMPPSQLIAQNSVGLRDMGAAMGATRFLQTMGMSIGTAVMGAVYTSRLADSLTGTLGARGADLVSGGAQIPPSALHALSEPVQDALRLAVTNGIQGVFWVGTAFAVAGVVVSWLIKEVPLRGSIDQSADEDSEAGTEDSETGVGSAVTT
ncbi:MAG: MDR family MFS transporter [Nocardioidaceae bacterium]